MQDRESNTRATSPSRVFDRQLWLILILTSLVIIPRSVSIALEHSETIDASYHLQRGLAYLTRSIAKKDLHLNDPPLGEGIVAVPLLITNLIQGRSPDDARLFNESGRAELAAVGGAIWNGLLFLPLAGIVFHWTRQLYGARSGWLATAAVVLDPNFAAFTPLAMLDVLCATAITITCLLAWRYFKHPTPGRLAALGVGIGTSLMIKHVAIMLPVLVTLLAILFWLVRPILSGQARLSWRSDFFARLPHLLVLGLVIAVTIWTLTQFELCSPKSSNTPWRGMEASDPIKARYLKIDSALRLTSPWPAGTYLRSLRSGLGHGIVGHYNYLFGELSRNGWWYYYPVVASYKIPIGTGVLALLGILSLRRVSPRWGEWGLFLPLLLWSAFLIKANINIGFRHFLFPYLAAIMLASRCVASGGRAYPPIAWAAVFAAGLHAVSFHPDYLSYINYPRRQPYLSISDSNVDWGQGLKQVRRWIDRNPPGGRTVWIHYFGIGVVEEGQIPYYLGDRARPYNDGDPLPTSGILIISPVFEAGVYCPTRAFKALSRHQPVAVIGHSLRVYDLDRLTRESQFQWPDADRE